MLQPKETSTFFKNWLGVLAFVNDRHNLEKDFGHPKKPLGIKLETIVTIKTKLWEDVGIIDEYIDSVWDLQRDEIQIGPNMRRDYRDRYSQIKKKKGIISTLAE
jgi:hypothetical protein